MRGKGFGGWLKQARQGITPAYAGKRAVYYSVSVVLRDHPRLCGEKFRRFFGGVSCPGSPPPMRGKEFDDGQQKTIGRITPAYAGKRLHIL